MPSPTPAAPSWRATWRGRMPVQGSGDELDRLALALNEMLDQIERLMAGMQEVSSNVAHDLKTPLTRMKARVEAALRSGNARPSTARRWKSTVEESDRLLDTFNALLSIARAEAGQSRSGLEPIDASQVIADVAELYEPMAEELGGTSAVRCSPGPECPGRPPAAGPGPEQSDRQRAQIRCHAKGRGRRSRSPARWRATTWSSRSAITAKA